MKRSANCHTRGRHPLPPPPYRPSGIATFLSTSFFSSSVRRCAVAAPKSRPLRAVKARLVWMSTVRVT